jgi:GTP pyrophosphokinase
MKQKTFQDLKQLIQHKSADDRRKIQHAYDFASLAHTGVVRVNGEPYLSHVLETAYLTAVWKLDTTSIVAALLHDSVSDGAASREDLVSHFGEEVAQIVDGVTTISNLRLKGSNQDLFVESLRKMILMMARDLRVVFVKLADRTHNIETLSVLPVDKQRKIAKETMEVYAPLAERLGMGGVKARLEDLTFPFLYPQEYKRVLTESRPFYKKAEEHTEIMKEELSKGLSRESIEHEVFGRQKHLYSLFKKLGREEIDWDYSQIHDIVALRILVKKVSDCYAALGIVHGFYKPVPHLGISDFIAQPKPNGYRSIHTKVFGPDGRIVEVQIRTFDMHDQAEHGVAAHWAYADAKSHGVSSSALEEGKVSVSTDKLVWVKQLVEWQKEMSDTDEFTRAVKFDALTNRNFVFSPKGDVYDLPAGATPVDFAFSVHTVLGKYISGAKVNGKIVPLDYKLKSGDVIEILKSKHEHMPNRDWLRFVVTASARKGINKNHK